MLHLRVQAYLLFFLFIVYTNFVYDTSFVFIIANVHDVILFKISRFESYQLVALRAVS